MFCSMNCWIGREKCTLTRRDADSEEVQFCREKCTSGELVKKGSRYVLNVKGTLSVGETPILCNNNNTFISLTCEYDDKKKVTSCSESCSSKPMIRKQNLGESQEVLKDSEAFRAHASFDRNPSGDIFRTTPGFTIGENLVYICSTAVKQFITLKGMLERTGEKIPFLKQLFK